MQIASITTNGQGEYEYATEEDYLEQTLDFVIQKEGFEIKNISYEIDKAEIKSDILLNELEKGTKEKTRIFGTIRNSKNRDPVKAASITLSIEGTQIASVSSNEQGEYEYTADEDYTGQTLDFIIQKEGFIKKNISSEIDKLEIKSDILIDKIEIEIKGKICDKADLPLADASISFKMGDKTIKLISDKDGSFSFTAGQQFLNQSIGYEVSKEGFKVKSGKLELIEDLKCINLDPPIPIWIKVAVVSIALIGLAIVAIVILQDEPELAIDSDPLNFNFESGTSTQTFSIWNDGDGTLEWDVYSEPDWIMVSPDSGTDSGVVFVSVNSAGMDLGRHTGIITVESNGGNETVRVSLSIEKPTVEPTLEPLRIHNFIAEPNYIDGPRGETTLSWEVSGATSVTIDGFGPVEISEGSIDTWVEQTTTFILRATNEAGVSDVRTTIVYIEGEPVDKPVIYYFIANPGIISTGEKSTLEWDVSGVETVTINNEIGEKDGIGYTNVSPDETTTFILTAENDAGKAVETVEVEVLEPELFVDPGQFPLNFELSTFSLPGSKIKTFTISNSGEGNLNWSINAYYDSSIYNWNWITVDPQEGDLKANNEEIITITINTAGLELDDYQGGISIDSNGGTFDGDINLVFNKKYLWL